MLRMELVHNRMGERESIFSNVHLHREKDYD